MKATLSLLAGLLLMMPGCSQINVADYSGFTNIPPSGMPTGWEYELAPEAVDSVLDLSKLYDVVLSVRYTASCPSKNIIFNIEEFSMAHERPDSSKVELQLFDKDGQPEGHSRYGIIEITDTIRKDYHIPAGYSFSLSSPLPQEATRGIKAVGLILVDKDKPKQPFKIKI